MNFRLQNDYKESGWNKVSSGTLLTRGRDRPGGWKNAGEGTAPFEFTVDPQAGVMAQQDMLDNRQSQPGAARVAGTGCVHPVKALRQVREV